MNKMPATLADQPQPRQRLSNYANTLGQGILNGDAPLTTLIWMRL